MRMIMTKDSISLETLSTMLLGGNAGNAARLEELKKLNPHVDFKKIAPGSVLLVPDSPDFKSGEAKSVSGEAFSALQDQLTASVALAIGQAGQNHTTRLAEWRDVNAALKSPAVKRRIEADPELQPQLEEAAKLFKQDQEAAKAAESMLKTLKEDVAVELAALAKILA